MPFLISEDLRDRIHELEFLNKSTSGELAFAESTLESLRDENHSLRRSFDNELLDMKLENSKMKDKVDRINELSAENLLLASDAADLQGELTELRSEARDLRNRCHDFTEENRQLKMEVRDLRRYIDAICKNRNADPRQELLDKIDYYQSEHDRLLEEIRSLKLRLGDLTPKSPRSRSPVSRSPRRSRSPVALPRSQHSTGKGVRFSDKPVECKRTAAGDALAAVTATTHAVDRMVGDRTMSPSVALNLRDLTMDRYQKHMEGESPRSLASDNTECLLKPYSSKRESCARNVHDSDEDEEFNESTGGRMLNGKRSGSPGRSRDSNRRSQISPVSRSRSTSPQLGAAGYRSLSPRNPNAQRCTKPTTDYPPEMAKSLPRRAFAPRNPSDLKLGYAIKFTRPGGKVSRGSVKYIGHLPGRSEVFVGVESDTYDGKHCGTFQGSKYFSCPPNKGIFTPFSKLILAWE